MQLITFSLFLLSHVYIQVNLSFSLISELDEDDNQKFTEDLLDFFIDSVGATLTEINDAQLK